MANPEHVAILQQGVAAWNAWRRERPWVQPDLLGADLSSADLAGADLRRADLNRADLSYANLSYANLSEANLMNADLRRANLSEALLSYARLGYAKLGYAKLSAAHLNGADLSEVQLLGANLTEANLSAANLCYADLRNTHLSGAHLNGADLDQANLMEADLNGADLSRASLVETDLTNVNLTGCRVYGASVWDVKLEGAIQENLLISPSEKSAIQVDDLEIAQFIYLLLNRQKLRNVITTLGEKGVLILGRFTERKELLDGIAAKLRDFGYLPIIFDFERPTDRDITETVKILAGLSAFVIADITNPRSVPLELQATVPDYMVPFVTMLQEGQPAFGMFDDLPRKYHWALPLLEYPNPERLLANFEDEVIQPALTKWEQVRYEKAAPPPRRKIK